MVRDFMLQREFAFPGGIIAEKIGRNGNIFVKQAEGEWSANSGRFQDFDVAMATDQTTVSHDIFSKLQIGRQLADK